MDNAELIAALRWCPSHGCEGCNALDANGRCTFRGIVGVMNDAADLIEAQQARIAELENQDSVEMHKKQVARIAELEAQIPKDGEWIDMGDFAMCSVCKIAQRKKYRQYNGGFMWVRTDFCPSCGSRMAKGEQE